MNFMSLIYFIYFVLFGVPNCKCSSVIFVKIFKLSVEYKSEKYINKYTSLYTAINYFKYILSGTRNELILELCVFIYLSSSYEAGIMI